MSVCKQTPRKNVQLVNRPSENTATMSTEVQQQIQQDWENREFIEIVSEGIKKIAEFLNDFGELELLSISHETRKTTSNQLSISYLL